MSLAKSYNAKTFSESFRKHLADGEKALNYLIDAYVWAQSNWKQIRRFTPDFDRKTMREEFKRVFHFDPAAYIAAAKKFGGGMSPSHFERGKTFVDKLGIFDSISAARKLNEDEAKELARRHEKNGVDRRALMKELDAIVQGKQESRSVPSWKQRCIELERENAALRKEVEILRELLTDNRKSAV